MIDYLIGLLLMCVLPPQHIPETCVCLFIGHPDLPVRRGRGPFRAGQGLDGGGGGHHGEGGALLGRRRHGLEDEARGQHDYGHHDEQLGEWSEKTGDKRRDKTQAERDTQNQIVVLAAELQMSNVTTTTTDCPAQIRKHAQ